MNAVVLTHLSAGSTIVVLFKKSTVTFDEDILADAQQKLENLVTVGQHIGTAIRK